MQGNPFYRRAYRPISLPADVPPRYIADYHHVISSLLSDALSHGDTRSRFSESSQEGQRGRGVGPAEDSALFDGKRKARLKILIL
jgi:hypothetical protein